VNLFSTARAKDAALEHALRLFLRQKMQRYGEIRELKLDTSAKVLSAEVQLLGDPLPLTISEAHYRLEKRGDTTWVIVHGIRVSREWAQNLLEDYFREIPLKIPEFIRPLLE
jgi:hypothetical protein